MTTTSARAGLVLLALLSIGDITVLFITDGNYPPYDVAVVSLILGVGSLAVLPTAWRGRPRATLALSMMRIVSALFAIPAFFVDPGIAVVAAAVAIVGATVLGVVLIQLPASVNARAAGASVHTKPIR